MLYLTEICLCVVFGWQPWIGLLCKMKGAWGAARDRRAT